MQPAQRIFMGLHRCNMTDIQYLSQSVVTVCVKGHTDTRICVWGWGGGGVIFIIHMNFHPDRSQKHSDTDLKCSFVIMLIIKSLAELCASFQSVCYNPLM